MIIKKKLPTVTLLGIDCLNLERLKLALEICQESFDFADVKILTSLQTSETKQVVKISPINSLEEYSHFVLWELDKYIETDYVLIVQHDGFILNPQAWTDEFLNYDYIGAPWLVADWAVKNYDFPVELVGSYLVGNGGFSLRSKKLLSVAAKLAQQGSLSRYNPEDTAISLYHRALFESEGIKFAPVEIAKCFSFEGESLDDYAWNGQFGFHGLKWTDISKWSRQHPQYQIDNPATNKSEVVKYL